MRRQNPCKYNGAIPRSRNVASQVQRLRSTDTKLQASTSAGNTPVGSPILPRSRGRGRYCFISRVSQAVLHRPLRSVRFS